MLIEKYNKTVEEKVIKCGKPVGWDGNLHKKTTD